MRIPMPSPRGTNREGLFLRTMPRAAYDAALQDDVAANLLTFLKGKLSEEDLAEFVRLAGVDPNIGMDEPEPFPGTPKVGGTQVAQDAHRRASAYSSENMASFAERFPHAAKIRIG